MHSKPKTQTFKHSSFRKSTRKKEEKKRYDAIIDKVLFKNEQQ